MMEKRVALMQTLSKAHQLIDKHYSLVLVYEQNKSQSLVEICSLPKKSSITILLQKLLKAAAKKKIKPIK